MLCLIYMLVGLYYKAYLINIHFSHSVRDQLKWYGRFYLKTTNELEDMLN